MENVKKLEFIKELAELYKKYGMTAGACGCCGGPSVYEDMDNDEIDKSIQHLIDN